MSIFRRRRFGDDFEVQVSEPAVIPRQRRALSLDCRDGQHLACVPNSPMAGSVPDCGCRCHVEGDPAARAAAIAKWSPDPRRSLGLVAVLAVAALLLAGCGSKADNDRSSSAGRQPDTVKDAAKVTVYRNADNVPNVALFCLDGRAFWSTLSGTDGGNNKSSTLIRDRELDDSYCGGGS